MRSDYIKQPIVETQSVKKHSFRKLLLTGFIIFAAAAIASAWQSHDAAQYTQTPVQPVTQAAAANPCVGNALDKRAVVSISGRKVWLCEGSKSVYEAPAITGMEAHESTKTPVGTYKIYAKVTNTILTGQDETGSWRDPVYYWMPFLDNQFGTYGFHDATWRDLKEFGAVDANTDKASHGCVELSKAAAARVYAWVDVGTTVTVKA